MVVRLANLTVDAPQLAASFGWPTAAVRAELSGAPLGKHSEHALALGADAPFLRALNVWDLRLYTDACRLAAERTSEAVLAAGRNTTLHADLGDEKASFSSPKFRIHFPQP